MCPNIPAESIRATEHVVNEESVSWAAALTGRPPKITYESRAETGHKGWMEEWGRMAGARVTRNDRRDSEAYSSIYILSAVIDL